MQPTVSIVLPAYNAGQYLAETLRSALAQTYTDYEILLLDNASTDNTQDVATSFTDPRLHYRRNATNIGFAGNVELGRSLAKAPFVVVLNADDVWEPTYLEKTVARLRDDPSLAFVHTHIYVMDQDSICFSDAITGWNPVTPGTQAFLGCFSAGFSFPTMLIRNEILRTVGPMPTAEPWGKIADSWLFLQLCMRGQVGFVSEPLLRYRVHAASMMGESYADGSFFRRRMASVRDAFAWPEVQPFVTAQDKQRALCNVARHAATTLWVIRNARGRWALIRAFAQVFRESPGAFLHPDPWTRLAYGMLPLGVIESLRVRKRRQWAERNANVRRGYPDAPGMGAARMGDAART